MPLLKKDVRVTIPAQAATASAYVTLCDAVHVRPNETLTSGRWGSFDRPVSVESELEHTRRRLGLSDEATTEDTEIEFHVSTRWLIQAWVCSGRYGRPITMSQVDYLGGLIVKGHPGLSQKVGNFFLYTDDHSRTSVGYLKMVDGKCRFRLFGHSLFSHLDPIYPGVTWMIAR